MTAQMKVGDVIRRRSWEVGEWILVVETTPNGEIRGLSHGYTQWDGQVSAFSDFPPDPWAIVPAEHIAAVNAAERAIFIAAWNEDMTERELRAAKRRGADDTAERARHKERRRERRQAVVAFTELRARITADNRAENPA